MFLYHISFFLRGNVYKQELIKNDNRFRNHEYQDILIEAHKNSQSGDDLEQKRENVLKYLESKYEFQMVKLKNH